MKLDLEQLLKDDIQSEYYSAKRRAKAFGMCFEHEATLQAIAERIPGNAYMFMYEQPIFCFRAKEPIDEAYFADLFQDLGVSHTETNTNETERQFQFTKNSLKFRIDVNLRDVCELIEVGTKVIPATEEKVVPVYELRCLHSDAAVTEAQAINDDEEARQDNLQFGVGA